MAEVAATRTPMTAFNERNCHIIEWAHLTNANTTAEAIEMGGFSDRSIQIEGTWDGATVVLKGSNDGANYQTLTDPQGNAISFTSSDRIEQIMELTRYIKPVMSGQGASTDITVTVFMKKAK